jgi:hypothetical protein
MGVNQILMFQFPKPTTILKHTLLLKSLHLIEFWFFIKIWIEMPFTHFALFIIFIEHQFKRFLKLFFFFVLSWLWPCIAHPIYLVEKRKKNDPTIKRGKIWIHFIQLAVRPTSILSPRRDQLVVSTWEASFRLGVLLSFSICLLARLALWY